MLNPLTLINASPQALLIKVGAAVIAVGLVFSGGAYSGYRWEHGNVLKLQLADAQFQTKAVNAAHISDALQAKVELKAATAEAYAQGALNTQTVTLTKEIVRYVTPIQDARVCIPVGLARVMRAAAASADPATLALAPGQSDDDCSDVTASEVAGWVAAYSGASNQNAEQLNALEAEIRANHDAQTAPPPVGDSP